MTDDLGVGESQKFTPKRRHFVPQRVMGASHHVLPHMAIHERHLVVKYKIKKNKLLPPWGGVYF
jgi:hypothetical protein